MTLSARYRYIADQIVCHNSNDECCSWSLPVAGLGRGIQDGSTTDHGPANRLIVSGIHTLMLIPSIYVKFNHNHPPQGLGTQTRSGGQTV